MKKYTIIIQLIILLLLVEACQSREQKEPFATPEDSLIRAVKNGYSTIVKILLVTGKETNSKEGYEALRYASVKGHADVVKILLDAGADPNYRFSGGSDPGFTILMVAVMNNHFDIVKVLLGKGAKVDAEAKNDIAGTTALFFAAEGNKPKIVRILLDYGADPNKREDYVGSTPLMTAACCGTVESVKILLEHGALVNVKDEVGATAIDYAKNRLNSQTVQFLKEAGAE